MAIDHNKADVEARFYHLQAKYWNSGFRDVSDLQSEIDSLEDFINNKLDTSEPIKKMLLARLCMKAGDFFSPSKFQVPYKSDMAFKNKDNALKNYLDAYEHLKSLNGDFKKLPVDHMHIVNMVCFRYASALENVKTGEGTLHEKAPKTLYEEIENRHRSIITNIENPETLYILLYILCASQARTGKKSEPKNNLPIVIKELKSFASKSAFYCYSPITNRMIKYEVLCQEIMEFEKELD